LSLSGFTRLFPLWAILLSLVAYLFPGVFTPMKSAIIPLLVVIMFGMGMTLTFRDFSNVLKNPRLLWTGVLLQYTIMPLAAFLVAKAMGLSSALTVGMVLVGCAPGGTASNVVCYLARGNVALSVSLTMLSTLVAFAMMPALTWLYVGKMVPVPIIDMLIDVLKIVIVPVLLGATLNTLLGKYMRRIRPVFPLVSVLAIVVIIAIIVALNHGRIGDLGTPLIIAIMLHNAIGLVVGYWVPRAMGMDRVTSRTLAIEVGMQNSGLAVALALKYFSAAAALPGAIFSIWHNLSGSLLASRWGAQRG
jgi:BASS family bile acid:Na+ symporter